MAQYDITAELCNYLDNHMIIAILDHALDQVCCSFLGFLICILKKQRKKRENNLVKSNTFCTNTSLFRSISSIFANLQGTIDQTVLLKAKIKFLEAAKFFDEVKATYEDLGEEIPEGA